MVIRVERFTLSTFGQEVPVFCCGGYDRDLPPGITYGPLMRDIYIIECNTSGYGSVVINGRTFEVGPRDCYILLPGDTVMHTASMEEPRCGVWCALDGMQVGRILAQVGITAENPYAPPELFDELLESVCKVVNIAEENDPGAELRRTGHLYNLLGILVRNSKTQNGNRAEWLTRVMGYMETYYSEDINVSDIAKVAGLERSYFSVRFKKETGMSPHTYLDSLRIRKACELIKKTNCTVSEIAELVGLDFRNFSRIFRKRTDITPTQYMKRYRE